MRDDVGVTASDVRQHHGDELARMSALEYDRYMRQRTAFWARHDIERHSGRADRTEKGQAYEQCECERGRTEERRGGRSLGCGGWDASDAVIVKRTGVRAGNVDG